MNKSKNLEGYRDLAKNIRKRVLEVIYKTKSPHIGSSFSPIEILVSLYFKVLRVFPENPFNPERDKFILSKGYKLSIIIIVDTCNGMNMG